LDTVLLGEEIIAVITEPLICDNPTTFDVLITILGIDRNGNGLDQLVGNIKIEETLASLNLDDASTEFIFSFDHDGECTTATGGHLSDGILMMMVLPYDDVIMPTNIK